MTTTRALVLVVDREVDELQTLCRGLFLVGVDCLMARDGGEAIAQLERPDGERVDLMVVDLTRPAELGAALVARARAVRPALPVLVLSGLALSPEVVALQASGIPLLRKPFTPDQLGRAIAALLGARPPTSQGGSE
jgi:DNA-binding response OmpR family regulator